MVYLNTAVENSSLTKGHEMYHSIESRIFFLLPGNFAAETFWKTGILFGQAGRKKTGRNIDEFIYRQNETRMTVYQRSVKGKTNRPTFSKNSRHNLFLEILERYSITPRSRKRIVNTRWIQGAWQTAMQFIKKRTEFPLSHTCPEEFSGCLAFSHGLIFFASPARIFESLREYSSVVVVRRGAYPARRAT